MSASPRARLMDGAAVAQDLLQVTTHEARRVAARAGRRPCLAAVLVGDDPASMTYVRMKRRRCEQIGVDSCLVHLPVTTSTAEAVAVVEALSHDPAVDGILVQHPVPAHVDERAVFEAVAPAKDVDGVTGRSFARMALGLPGPTACTPAGILRLLDAYDVELTGRHAVVIGCSPILGRPMGMLLLGRDATVTYCHRLTGDLPAIVRTADLVVAAAASRGWSGETGSARVPWWSMPATTRATSATWRSTRPSSGPACSPRCPAA